MEEKMFLCRPVGLQSFLIVFTLTLSSPLILIQGFSISAFGRRRSYSSSTHSPHFKHTSLQYPGISPRSFDTKDFIWMRATLDRKRNSLRDAAEFPVNANSGMTEESLQFGSSRREIIIPTEPGQRRSIFTSSSFPRMRRRIQSLVVLWQQIKSTVAEQWKQSSSWRVRIRRFFVTFFLLALVTTQSVFLPVKNANAAAAATTTSSMGLLSQTTDIPLLTFSAEPLDELPADAYADSASFSSLSRVPSRKVTKILTASGTVLFAAAGGMMLGRTLLEDANVSTKKKSFSKPNTKPEQKQKQRKKRRNANDLEEQNVGELMNSNENDDWSKSTNGDLLLVQNDFDKIRRMEENELNKVNLAKSLLSEINGTVAETTKAVSTSGGIINAKLGGTKIEGGKNNEKQEQQTRRKVETILAEIEKAEKTAVNWKQNRTQLGQEMEQVKNRKDKEEQVTLPPPVEETKFANWLNAMKPTYVDTDNYDDDDDDGTDETTSSNVQSGMIENPPKGSMIDTSYYFADKDETPVNRSKSTGIVVDDSIAVNGNKDSVMSTSSAPQKIGNSATREETSTVNMLSLEALSSPSPRPSSKSESIHIPSEEPSNHQYNVDSNGKDDESWTDEKEVQAVDADENNEQHNGGADLEELKFVVEEESSSTTVSMEKDEENQIHEKNDLGVTSAESTKTSEPDVREEQVSIPTPSPPKQKKNGTLPSFLKETPPSESDKGADMEDQEKSSFSIFSWGSRSPKSGKGEGEDDENNDDGSSSLSELTESRRVSTANLGLQRSPKPARNYNDNNISFKDAIEFNDPNRQPKSYDEEEMLKRKYAAIADLGERAYQILLDLGMVGQSTFDEGDGDYED